MYVVEPCGILCAGTHLHCKCGLSLSCRTSLCICDGLSCPYKNGYMAERAAASVLFDIIISFFFYVYWLTVLILSDSEEKSLL